MLKTSRTVAKTTNETDFNDASLHPGRNLGAEMGLRHQGDHDKVRIAKTDSIR
jgi:hypothetical protein